MVSRVLPTTGSLLILPIGRSSVTLMELALVEVFKVLYFAGLVFGTLAVLIVH